MTKLPRPAIGIVVAVTLIVTSTAFTTGTLVGRNQRSQPVSAPTAVAPIPSPVTSTPPSIPPATLALSTTSISGQTTTSTTLLEATADTHVGPTIRSVPGARSFEGWSSRVAAIDGFVPPSDCGDPLSELAALPNADRAYRSGVHQGLDFICEVRNRDAIASLNGRVVTVVRSFSDPTPEDRSAVLSIAANVGATPPWTLAMLFGNFVVIDHGVLANVGHTITIYAHLDSVDSAIIAGAKVEAGQTLGEIGNLGTDSSSRNSDRPRSIHLHWEIHVDNQFIGAGLDLESTRLLYSSLLRQ